MTFEEVLARINELAAIAKERDLTDEELKERDDLRAVFLKAFRSGLADQLEATKIVDPEGNDVTPEKIKQIQKEKGLFNRHEEGDEA